MMLKSTNNIDSPKNRCCIVLTTSVVGKINVILRYTTSVLGKNNAIMHHTTLVLDKIDVV